ncbi:Kinesin-like protein NACK2 [Capsicum baccatum]|uniref:Kinesin-like protein NACK2 n=1 Tax=Capsicum baccatum TaxID=33114 RepID=A0A2G2X3R8_CAPBA|nr:Kinesin-like protein NACK2 [Capsicum baccatum]
MSLHLVFEDRTQQIIMLWNLCHMSLVHRTQFYMFIKGDPSDQIYMEVELRRLTWLNHTLAKLGNEIRALMSDDLLAGYVSSSETSSAFARGFSRKGFHEREYLAKRVRLKLIADEREMFYEKWDIPPEIKRRRRLQLASKLWSDPLNMQNVSESAEVVSRLVGFRESGEHVSAQFCFHL